MDLLGILGTVGEKIFALIQQAKADAAMKDAEILAAYKAIIADGGVAIDNGPAVFAARDAATDAELAKIGKPEGGE